MFTVLKFSCFVIKNFYYHTVSILFCSFFYFIFLPLLHTFDHRVFVQCLFFFCFVFCITLHISYGISWVKLLRKTCNQVYSRAMKLPKQLFSPSLLQMKNGINWRVQDQWLSFSVYFFVVNVFCLTFFSLWIPGQWTYELDPVAI